MRFFFLKTMNVSYHFVIHRARPVSDSTLSNRINQASEHLTWV